MGLILVLLVLFFGFWFFRKHILARFTDPVTQRNRKKLGSYLLLLIGLFLLLLFWMAASMRS